MSTERSTDCEVAVIGAGVVGCAVALALARRGAAVTVMEAEPEPALGASGANSGILHTGFDSPPGELETQLILRSAELREAALATLGVPVVRCGAVMHVRDRTEREAISALQAGARANGVEAVERAEGALEGGARVPHRRRQGERGADGARPGGQERPLGAGRGAR